MRLLRLLVLVAVALAAYADFTPSAWRYRKLIHVEASPANALLIDRDVLVNAREDLADLRIVHAGDEVPFLIVAATARVKEVEVAATMLDRAVTAEGVEAVFSFPRVTPHNRLAIQTTLKNFRYKVRLYASPDGRQWALIKKDAYIFDFTADRHYASLLTLDYPTSTRRFLKVAIEGAKDPAILSGASVLLYEERPAIWQDIQKFDQPGAIEDRERAATSYTLDLGAANEPHDRIVMDIADPAFHRGVTAEWSGDGKTWAAGSFGTVYRTEGSESLELPAGGWRGRYLRLTFFHGDDKPLLVKSMLLQAIARSIVFPSRNAGDYWLYFGNPEARSPSYDLPMVLAKSTLDDPVSVNAGARLENPDYRPPKPPVKPLSERYPGLLYGVLGIAVLGLGYFTLLFMRSVKASSS